MEPIQETLADRLKLLIDWRADKRGKFAQLENLTQILAEHWKSFYYNRQRPNPDMIEAVARVWPEYAFWLVTGVTDSTHGHIGPESAYDCYLNTKSAEQPMAAAYLQKKTKLREKLMKAGREQPDDMELDDVMHALLIRDSVHDQIKRHKAEVELRFLRGDELSEEGGSLEAVDIISPKKAKGKLKE